MQTIKIVKKREKTGIGKNGKEYSKISFLGSDKAAYTVFSSLPTAYEGLRQAKEGDTLHIDVEPRPDYNGCKQYQITKFYAINANPLTTAQHAEVAPNEAAAKAGETKSKNSATSSPAISLPKPLSSADSQRMLMESITQLKELLGQPSADSPVLAMILSSKLQVQAQQFWLEMDVWKQAQAASNIKKVQDSKRV